ncbi:MAG: diacylglycerol kinase family lipid kinase [Bacteroidetes bacterium]|nr:diacylglycerol kinase family lipid kinase [Bacteroidota bacterium]MCL2302044.1 diacylglycerol kinase family lipid kinase [Lentimicrobiaceae bacterium]
MTSTKKKILFIINPISGGHNKAKVIRSIPKLLDKSRFDISITHTKCAAHAAEITKEAVEKNIDIVVAVGGDGTINEVASQLVNTNTTLAIVPCGSGNGLARDLGISLHYKKAIQQINSLKTKKIDVGICNDQYFFSLAGVGYDAKVAYDFNRRKKRRFLGYAWAILKDYFYLKNQYYEIELENEKITGKYFFITIANCSQWGYNVKVAPGAKLDNGMFVVNLCKKPPIFPIISFIIKMLLGKINTSKYNTFKTCRKILLTSNRKFFYHLDGDAKGVSQKVEIDILHQALNTVIK